VVRCLLVHTACCHGCAVQVCALLACGTTCSDVLRLSILSAAGAQRHNTLYIFQSWPCQRSCAACCDVLCGLGFACASALHCAHRANAVCVNVSSPVVSLATVPRLLLLLRCLLRLGFMHCVGWRWPCQPVSVAVFMRRACGCAPFGRAHELSQECSWKHTCLHKAAAAAPWRGRNGSQQAGAGAAPQQQQAGRLEGFSSCVETGCRWLVLRCCSSRRTAW
jgi:hypothetical protein